MKSWQLKILYKKNYGDKKGKKSFQQLRKMCYRKFRWPSMNVLQIKVRRLKLYVIWMFIETNLANVQSISTRKKLVCNWYKLSIRFNHLFREEGANVSKVYNLYSAFCTKPAFYPQSAVCILHSVCILPLQVKQSAVRSLRVTEIGIGIKWHHFKIEELISWSIL